jgi:hypothetical protein
MSVVWKKSASRNRQFECQTFVNKLLFIFSQFFLFLVHGRRIEAKRDFLPNKEVTHPAN